MPSRRTTRDPLAGRKATVTIVRNGHAIEIAGVPAAQAVIVLCALIEAVREAQEHYEELIPGPDVIPGGQATPVHPDDGSEERAGARSRRRIGF